MRFPQFFGGKLSQLSAGRVQSVAVRLIVERENEIKDFVSTSQFKVTAEFKIKTTTKPLLATLNKRFDKKEEVIEFLKACIGATFTIKSVEKRPAKQSPAPPFTTSTLQQGSRLENLVILFQKQ